jgi:hypothetical protein
VNLRGLSWPEPIKSVTGAAMISRGGAGGCAILGGRVLCWGGTPVLGNGDVSASTPAPPLLDCP